MVSVAIFWLAFIGTTFLQIYSDIHSQKKEFVETQKTNLNFLFRQSAAMLVSNNLYTLQTLMRDALDLKMSDFYILQKNGETIFANNRNGDTKSIEAAYVDLNIFTLTEDNIWKTIQIGDYKLTVGHHVNTKSSLETYFKMYWGYVLRDILTVTAVLAIILWLVLKDIMSLSKALQSGDKEAIKKIKGLSAEAQALLSATQAFENLDEEQKLQLELYGGTVGPAIMHELKSGRAAPYSFETTVVRVDLNGYTRMFLDKKEEYVVDILNRYFKAAREIIERHSGLVYQYVGDEIVFHIKNHEGMDSNVQALACVRSLFQEAEKIERSLPPGTDHQFRLKAAFSKGNLRFVSLDKGHALTGVPLIESVRLISNIQSRDQQILALRGPLTNEYQLLAKKWVDTDQDLKGLEDGVIVSQISSFKNFQELYASGANNSTGNNAIHLLRTDEDVASLIQITKDNFSKGKTDSAHHILTMMKTWRGTTPAQFAIHELDLLLQASFDASEKGLIHDVLMASLVMLVPKIISSDMMTQELMATLERGLKHKNPRTIANTIIALSHFNFDLEHIRPFFKHENNRVCADAFFACGMQKLDWDVGTGLMDMMKSSAELHRRSGEWVTKAMLKHYGDKDPVFASTNPVMKKLRRALSDYEAQWGANAMTPNATGHNHSGNHNKPNKPGGAAA